MKEEHANSGKKEKDLKSQIEEQQLIIEDFKKRKDSFEEENTKLKAEARLHEEKLKNLFKDYTDKEV